MGDEDVLLDTVLTGLGRRHGGDVFVLNIGAMDGVSFDGTRPYVDRYGWRGLFVEPVPELFERHGERIRVPATTLASLLARHGVERVDVLHIDVEGYDWEVLRQFDFDRYHPAVVRLETCSLPGDQRTEAREHLATRGYEVFDLGSDLAAIVPEALALDSTFVTAVYERRPDDVLGGRGFPLARYLPSLASIARMGAPLVVYTQAHLARRLSELLRADGADARVVACPLSSVPRFWEVEELRIRQRVHTLPHRDRCHVLCLAKFAWLAEQAHDNPFGTTRFYWIDAGLAHPGLFPARHLPRPDGRCDLFSPAVPIALRRTPGFFVFELSPLVGPNLHPVDVGDMQRIAGPGARPIATHIVGGMFGGVRDDVLRLYEEYDGILADMLAAGLLGTEENVLTILHARATSGIATQTFTTWYHEDTDFTQPAPHDVPFYRAFERLTRVS